MQLHPFRCPECNEVARGTVDVVAATALVHSDDQGQSFDWTGETEVNWDSQEAIRDSAGRVLLTCRNGHEWLAEEVDSPAPGQSWLQQYMAKLKVQPSGVRSQGGTTRGA